MNGRQAFPEPGEAKRTIQFMWKDLRDEDDGKVVHENLYEEQFERNPDKIRHYGNFNHKSVLEHHFAIHEDNRVAHDDVLQDIITSCLALDPDKRPGFDVLSEQLDKGRGNFKQTWKLWRAHETLVNKKYKVGNEFDLQEVTALSMEWKTPSKVTAGEEISSVSPQEEDHRSRQSQTSQTQRKQRKQMGQMKQMMGQMK
jgi:serine/threonine protein kinase